MIDFILVAIVAITPFVIMAKYAFDLSA